MTSHHLTPQAAYIHVPFCAHRCGYCNFSLVAGRLDLVDAYLTAIERELASNGHPNPVSTLYFGGGTPSQLSGDQFKKLAQVAVHWYPLLPDYEWTVEINPADTSPDLIGTLRECGVNRISIGAQSFSPRKLRVLERDHLPADIKATAMLAGEAGMQLCLDLIFGVPGETAQEWQSDLKSAIALKVDHVSTYGLTFERGTQFWSRRSRGEFELVSECDERLRYEQAICSLEASGLEHYEISNFAMPGKRSRHNQVYWSGGEYFAAGPGAARYIAGVRETNHRSTTTYLKRVLAGDSPVAEREVLSDETKAREKLIFGLRRREGVCREEFSQKTDLTIEDLANGTLEKFLSLGLLEEVGTKIRLTHEGLLVSDSMWPELV